MPSLTSNRPVSIHGLNRRGRRGTRGCKYLAKQYYRWYYGDGFELPVVKALFDILFTWLFWSGCSGFLLEASYSQWESRRNEWKEKLYKEHNEKFNIKHQRDPRPDLPYPSTIDDQDLWVKNIEILDQRLKDFVKMMTGNTQLCLPKYLDSIKQNPQPAPILASSYINPQAQHSSSADYQWRNLVPVHDAFSTAEIGTPVNHYPLRGQGKTPGTPPSNAKPATPWSHVNVSLFKMATGYEPTAHNQALLPPATSTHGWTNYEEMRRAQIDQIPAEKDLGNRVLRDNCDDNPLYREYCEEDAEGDTDEE